ncbi:hypothetical protein CCR75_001754 [Bremia lactucae]|uniref:Glycoside hydrolase n=1 Tax=Bremia lactucae TaxID=4779 RepID=A0A976IHC3_BRELC|nr:hypothetical protein CCR75_001754 [Bremia lactucae]
MVKVSRTPLAMIALAWSCLQFASSAEDLCSITPSSYTMAKTTHPHLASALTTIEQYAIVAWYTDRTSEADRSAMLSSITTDCSEDSRMTIAVYGIPNKDCNAGLSTSGSVQSTTDYESFLSTLSTAVKDRKVLYIIEPDAVGLLAENGCGQSSGYLDNLKIAIATLSANPNAELYVDVGYWFLADPTKAAEVAAIIKELGASGSLKGIAINTSNYRSNDECITYCNNFQAAMGSSTMTCIIDTSRNYNGSPTSDWCNVKTAGIGKPPTSETGISNIDYFMWVKPPGESDGICTNTMYSTASLTGVQAGAFYEEGFKALWDQGYFASEQSMAGNSTDNANQSSSQAGAEVVGSDLNQTSIGQNSDFAQYVGTVAPVDIDSPDNTTTTPPLPILTPNATDVPSNATDSKPATSLTTPPLPIVKPNATDAPSNATNSQPTTTPLTPILTPNATDAPSTVTNLQPTASTTAISFTNASSSGNANLNTACKAKMRSRKL